VREWESERVREWESERVREWESERVGERERVRELSKQSEALNPSLKLDFICLVNLNPFWVETPFQFHIFYFFLAKLSRFFFSAIFSGRSKAPGFEPSISGSAARSWTTVLPQTILVLAGGWNGTTATNVTGIAIFLHRTCLGILYPFPKLCFSPSAEIISKSLSLLKISPISVSY
jgi:hypothetical protein